MSPQPTKSLHYQMATSLAFLVLAIAGWAAFTHSAKSSTEQQSTYEQRIQELTAERDRLKLERDEWRGARERLAEVERELAEANGRFSATEVRLLAELSAAQEEARQLATAREEAIAEVSTARQEVASLQEQLEESSRPAPPRQPSRRATKRTTATKSKTATR